MNTKKIYNNLMSGVSHFLPFVIGGGILTAMAYLLETGLDDVRARFDVAEVYVGKNGSLRVEYLEDAFT